MRQKPNTYSSNFLDNLKTYINMNKNLFSRTAATSFVLGLAMAASAQQANFLSNNHCIYRVDNSQKVLLLPVQ